MLQGMYLLLVTNKASNILEDLETLRLMSKVLPEYVLPPVDEESIIGAAFELLFAFDEVISLGYKENVTVGQVKQNTEMESHEEKLHKMIIQSKVQDTKVGCSRPTVLPISSSQAWLCPALRDRHRERCHGDLRWGLYTGLRCSHRCEYCAMHFSDTGGHCL